MLIEGFHLCIYLFSSFCYLLFIYYHLIFDVLNFINIYIFWSLFMAYYWNWLVVIVVVLADLWPLFYIHSLNMEFLIKYQFYILSIQFRWNATQQIWTDLIPRELHSSQWSNGTTRKMADGIHPRGNSEDNWTSVRSKRELEHSLGFATTNNNKNVTLKSREELE